jgi:hypothetical protein
MSWYVMVRRWVENIAVVRYRVRRVASTSRRPRNGVQPRPAEAGNRVELDGRGSCDGPIGLIRIGRLELVQYVLLAGIERILYIRG